MIEPAPNEALAENLEKLTFEELQLLRWQLKWRKKARPKQLPPDGAWTTWGLRTGRGWGKTETGASWLIEQAATNPCSYCFVVSPTHDDVRYTCFEGPTGIDAIIPPALVITSDKNLPSRTLWNGSVIRGFAAESPERLRGPQCHFAWCDEIASWRYPTEAWDNLKMGHRLGSHPRLLWTGTPKPTPFMRDLLKLPNSIIITGSVYENKDNLPSSFFDDMQKYEGTKIGRQELYGEMIDPEDSGYIRRSQWRLWKAHDPLPRFHFVVMSLDTAFTERSFDRKHQEGDPTACSVWGVFEIDGKCNAMLLDAWEDHLGFPDLTRRVKKERLNSYGAPDVKLADIHGPMFGRPMYGEVLQGTGRVPDLILIEDKGSGISLRQALAVEDVLTTPYNPGRMDKLSRLHAISPMFAAGRVWAVESNQHAGQFRSWAEPLVSQVCTYIGTGSTEHDDLLDTTTQALKYVSDRFMGAFTLPPKSRIQLLEDAASSRPRPMVNGYAQ